MASLNEILGYIKDAAQGASNSAASNVSAPVDAINWVLKKGGMGSENPVLGSDWMRQQGLTAEPQNAVAGGVGDFLGMIIPIVGAAKAGQIAQAMLKGGENLSAAPELSRQAGALRIGGDAPMGERIVQAPKVVSVPDRFKTGDKAGIYRGTEAFGGISPQKVSSMRKNYMNKMEVGAGGRNWYDESSNDIYRWTGGDHRDADKMANMLAITSSRTPVASNLMYANKGWNQDLVGDVVRTGGFPTNMGNKIMDSVASPEAMELGLKRSPFSAGLSVEWRGPDFANRPTHDIHDARAWGITDPKTGDPWNKGIPDAGHRFLDKQAFHVTDRANERGLGGVSDWTPYRAQAAAWIAQKAAHEGIPIGDAARHYGSFAPEYQGMLTREWLPGRNTGHLPELLDAPVADQIAYSDALEGLVTGREGIDKLARDSGALVDRTVPGPGFHEGAVSPGYSSMINVGKGKGSQEVDDASQRVMNALSSAHGLLGTQKQVANNYMGGPAGIGRAGTIRFPGSATDEELARLQQNMNDTFGVDTVMRDPQGGARVLNFLSPKARTDMAKAIRPPKWAPPGMYDQPEFRAQSASLIPESAPENWSAKPFIAEIDKAGPMAGRISEAMKPIAGGILDVVGPMAAEKGWTQAPWFKPMMEGIRDGGIPRLKELVRLGIVPVVALTAIAGAMEPGQGQGGVD